MYCHGTRVIFHEKCFQHPFLNLVLTKPSLELLMQILCRFMIRMHLNIERGENDTEANYRIVLCF